MRLIITILLIVWGKVYAQPGCIPEKGLTRYFISISDSINKNPADYSLRWERIQEIKTPICDGRIQTRPAQNNVVEYENDSTIVYYKLDLIKDLSLLIDNEVKIESRFDYLKADKYNFHHQRGEQYLVGKDTSNALSDFHKALETSYRPLKTRVAKVLSDHYYNLSRDNTSDRKNYRKALYYLDLVSPLEFTDSLLVDIPEPYSSDKINLLKYLGEDVRLENYYKKLILNQYEIFKRRKAHDDAWSRDEVHADGYGYTTNESYLNTFNYVNELANFYFDRKNYKKAKWLTEQAIHLYPKNSSGYIVDRYSVGKHYLLLNKIYQTKEHRDIDEEMNMLLELLGGSTHGINYDAKKIGAYIDNRLKEHPKESRLYLALAIWHYKNNFGQSSPTASSAEILNILNEAEKLKLADYRLYYAKAMVYLNLEKRYEQGVAEIDKALKRCTTNPFIYGAKFQLLRNLPTPNEHEIKFMNQESLKKRKPLIYKDLTSFLKEI